MKKFLTTISAMLLAIVLCLSIAGCGATSTLSSYVKAVKNGDFEKASSYVVGQPSLSNPESETGEIYDYIYDKTAGSFSYSVEETTTNDDETTTTVKISYSCYSSTKLLIAYAAAVLKGSETSKSTVNDCLKEMEKSTGTLTVVIVKDEEAGWLMEAASATSLLGVIYL